MLLVALSAWIMPFVSYGQTVLRTDETVTVDSDQIVEGNFYSVGSRVSISGEVTGDWIAAGAHVTGNGQYHQDVLLIAANAQMHGSTTDDLRIVAGDVVIADYVGGDLAVLGGTVEILSSAIIEGDVLMYASNVVIAGSVGGDVLGRYGTLRIDGPVGGSLDVYANDLTLGNKAVVEGNITYESLRQMTRAQDSVVEGDVIYREITTSVTMGDRLQNLLIPMLVVVFAALTFFLIQRRRFDAVVEHIVERPLLVSLIGVLIILGTPLLVVIMFASVLGALVGAAVFSLYILLLTMGAILTVPVLGRLVGRYILKRDQLDLLTIFSGAVALFILLMIPVFGLALALVVLFVTVGGFATWLYQR